MPAPLVAITTYHLGTGQVRTWDGAYALPEKYVAAVCHAGARTALLPAAQPSSAEELLAPFDGLLLPGGGDLEPGRYGAAAHPALGGVDAGPGIPETERQRIFDRFTQLERHSQRRGGGVGLGLYIARQLARSQDGDLLVVEPAGGRGARFELHLPLLPEAAGP